MTVGIIRANWSGTTGGPGLTQFAIAAGGAGGTYTPTDAQNAVNDVRAFFAALQGVIPNEVTITVSPTVDQYDQASGQLVASIVAASAPTPMPGGASGNYAGGVGFKYDWNTGVIHNGRRVVGHTYIVPAAAALFDTDGTLTTTFTATLNAAASGLLSALAGHSLGLQVWSRPPTVPGVGGILSAVASGSYKDKSAILRGRRD